jgi:ParB-like chromosome segregation protein Spo0J
MKLGELETHPAADAFPLMTGELYRQLVADIKAHGLRDDIVVCAGKVLDGRNRQRACEDAGVEPRYREYDGNDPIGFVVSANLCRRHLNESQRALVAAKLATLPRGGRKQTGKVAASPTQRDAAEKLNVSERTVRDASALLKRAVPELVQAVEKGELSVAAAAELATLPAAEQRARLEASQQAETKRGRAALVRRDAKPANDEKQTDFTAQLMRTIRRSLSDLGATISAAKGRAGERIELEFAIGGQVWELVLAPRPAEDAA